MDDFWTNSLMLKGIYQAYKTGQQLKLLKFFHLAKLDTESISICVLLDALKCCIEVSIKDIVIK